MTNEIATIVGARIGKLQGGYLADRSEAVAALARLRRGAGKPAGSVLDIIEHTHAEEFVRGWDDDAPSYAENAAHVAMTLFALHQQSQRKAVHVPGRRFGTAVRRLSPEQRPDGPVMRRFAALGTADSFTELSHHLRGLVQLMRSGTVRLDYGQLARDLWLWQLPGRAPQVRLRWGRDFHFPNKDAEDTEQ
ncbi:type I-E CRISPR-associated protein Cse2/CasB [Actinophytocola sediminis]